MPRFGKGSWKSVRSGGELELLDATERRRRSWRAPKESGAARRKRGKGTASGGWR